MRIIILLILLPFICSAQLPYTWTTGVNPGWTSANSGSGGALNWNAGCSVVTTNCSGIYSNNQNTSYTSPTINTSCSNASSVNITFSASGNAEYGFDFLFIEYSLDNGVTWINPYGVGVGWTGNFGAGSTIPAITIPTSTTFKFRFTFQSDGSNRSSGYKITDFDIWCNIVLPIEIVSFNGYDRNNYNLINWVSATEINNDYYTLERSIDGISWDIISLINGSGNSSTPMYYEYKDYSYKKNSYNYYRLKQTDFNGINEYFNIIVVDNSKNTIDKTLIKVTDLMGQDVDPDTEGILVYYYSDGTHQKICKIR